MRRILIVLLLMFTLGAQAQKNTVWGYLRDSVTHEPIPLASITNLNTGKVVMTGYTGRFRVEATNNQVFSFAAIGYHFDTITYSGRNPMKDTVTVYLSPLVRDLGNVTVTAKGYNRYQLDSMERRKDFMQGTVDYVKPIVSSGNSGAGIGLNLDRFSKHEKNKRKMHAFFETNEDEAYVNYRFSAAVVAQYTGLKDDALQDFMQQYRPTAKWLRAHPTDEDILYYVNDKLKLYFKRPK
jgi:hypothetical protein